MSESVELTEADITAIIEAFQKPDRTVAMFQAVARIKAAARREALLEAAEVLGQLRYTGGNVDFADGREFEAGRIAGWLLELAEPERDEEGGR